MVHLFVRHFEIPLEHQTPPYCLCASQSDLNSNSDLARCCASPKVCLEIHTMSQIAVRKHEVEEGGLVGEDRPDEFHIIDLSTARVNRLQQLINLFVAHLLAQICQDVSQLANSNET